MGRNVLHILATTRGRRHSVERMLRSVAAVASGLSPRRIAACVVHDAERAPLDESLPLETRVIDAAGFRRALHVLADQVPSFCLRAWFRTPGHGPWDAAAMRNFGLLLIAVAVEDGDLVCMMDDDIIVAETPDALGSRYNSARIRDAVRDGGALIEAASVVGETSDVVAGASYVGVADLSRRQHVELLLPRIDEWIDDPRCAPCVVLYEGGDTTESGPGNLSGAFLVLSPEALAVAPMARFYNEDWIWLQLVERAGFALQRVEQPVAHVPPCAPEASAARFAMQQVGEAVYDALHITRGDAAPCRATADAMAGFRDVLPVRLEARACELDDLAVALDAAERTLSGHTRRRATRALRTRIAEGAAIMRCTDAKRIAGRLSLHFATIVHWKALIGRLREGDTLAIRLRNAVGGW